MLSSSVRGLIPRRQSLDRFARRFAHSLFDRPMRGIKKAAPGERLEGRRRSNHNINVRSCLPQGNAEAGRWADSRKLALRNKRLIREETFCRGVIISREHGANIQINPKVAPNYCPANIRLDYRIDSGYSTIRRSSLLSASPWSALARWKAWRMRKDKSFAGPCWITYLASRSVSWWLPSSPYRPT